MYYLILTTLLGISFAPFLFSKLDIWHAQGMWVQLCLMVCFSWSFFENRKHIPKRNLPLGLMHLWVGLYTAFICMKSQELGKYEIRHFFPYFNFLCVLIFYKLITEHIGTKEIYRIVVFIKYLVLLTLLMCVLQFFGISQFFALIEPESRQFNNLVVGFIGNGTHLSGFLASCIPIFLFFGKREDWLAIILTMVVLTQTGTTTHDPSISGFIISICLFVYFYKSWWWLLLILPCVYGYSLLPDGFFSTSGRITIWRQYIPMFRQLPITGFGVGTINQIYQQTQTPSARHLHMEFFHFTFELGLIGSALMINMIKGFFDDVAETKLELTLKAMVLGFLISSCFNYPAHLWLPATFAVFAYASIYAIRSEQNTYRTDVWPNS